jgi:GAF domain-containing protein
MKWSDDVPNDPAFHDPIFREFPTQSLLLAPLRAQEEVVGMLACAWWTERRRLTAEERQLVEGIAGQAATAIVNARLYAEAAQAAIAAERIRVDNLLHDTFRQTLFSIGLRIERSLRGQQRLSTVRSIIQDIKRDVSVMMDQVNLVVALDSPPTACHPAAPASTGETGV